MTSPFDPLLVESLRTATHVTVLTGAGVSAESGIPTFRDAVSGLSSKFDPAELATPEAFKSDPALVTRWYDERRCNVARCQPNPGHVALARLEQTVTRQGGKYSLITQNVDRLHQAAGSSAVIELHGTLWVWRCTECDEEVEERGPAFETFPPRCRCGGHRRPGVVWFGEELPRHEMLQARRASAACRLFLSLGTSSVVYPAAGLVDLARKNGARLLEVNPQDTPISDSVDWSIRGRGVLPKLFVEAFGS